MGAHNEAETIKVDTNKGETFRGLWKEYISSLYHQYGHDNYNGTFTTCDGGAVSTVTLPPEVDKTDENAVFYWLWDNTEKWECAKAVKVSDVDGIETWHVGGWAAE